MRNGFVICSGFVLRDSSCDFFVYLFKHCKHVITDRSSLMSLFIVLLMLLILCGFASHSIIKFRPYNATPFLTYKCIASVIEVYLLTADGIARFSRVNSQTSALILVVCLSFMLLLNAWTRPHYEFRTYVDTNLWTEGYRVYLKRE